MARPVVDSTAHWADRFAGRLWVSDVLAVAVAGLVVHLVDVGALLRISGVHVVPAAQIAVSVALLSLWIGALSVLDTRERRFLGRGPEEYKAVVRATLLLFAVVVGAYYLVGGHLPRAYVAVMMPVGLLGLLLSRFAWRRWLHRRRGRGDMMTRVLAVGDEGTVSTLIRDLHRSPVSGYRIVAVCLPEAADRPNTLESVPVIGSLADVVDAVNSLNADAVAVTSSGAVGPEAVRQLSWALEDTSADLMLAPALTNIAGPRIHTLPVAGLPLIHVDRPTYRNANRLLKRCFDLGGAGLLAVVLSPLLLAIAAAVALSGPGGVFFRQERVGLHGCTFRMIKFRSMVKDAEQRLEPLKAHEQDAGNDVLYKMKDDPRVTRVGRLLRRYSLDELPQLFNVLRGGMSLVGPRPPLLREVQLYGADARRRLLVKPGMTGLWQVSGRSDLTWDDSVRLDVYYVENWSVMCDLVILWKTVRAVVSSSGAY